MKCQRGGNAETFRKYCEPIGAAVTRGILANANPISPRAGRRQLVG